MKLLTAFGLSLLLAGCAHGFRHQHQRGPASVTEEDELVVNPGRYDVYCGALLPASEHFELIIRKGSAEAVIVHNNMLKPGDRTRITQRYPVKLADTKDSYVFSGEKFELRMLKSDYTTNSEGETLVPSHLKAEFQGKNLGIDGPGCVLEEPKN